MRFLFIFLFCFLNTKSFAVNCQAVINPSLIFGNYNPTVAGNYDTKTTIKILCRPDGIGGLVTLRVKTAAIVENKNFRIMKNSKNENMNFRLYKDQNYLIPIDDNTELLKYVGIFRSEKNFEIMIFGRIYPFQNIGTGNYQINLPISIEWRNGPN